MPDRYEEMAKALAAAIRHPAQGYSKYAEVEEANARLIAQALRDVERETVERCSKALDDALGRKPS